MPTYARTEQFKRDFEALTPDDKVAFKRAAQRFVADLPSRRFRKGLRVKGIKGAPGVFELTWASNGRATFQYGPEVASGEAHVVWRRCGGHEIFGEP